MKIVRFASLVLLTLQPGLLALSCSGSRNLVKTKLEEIASVTPIATSTPIRPVVDNSGRDCLSQEQQLTFGYVPNIPIKNREGDERLALFGTIFAADYKTPLPGAQLEVWWINLDGQEPPFSSSVWNQVQTDAAGRYEIDILRPDQPVPPSIHYRVSYQGKCLVAMQVGLAREYGPYQVQLPGPILRGPIDIVLPVKTTNFRQRSKSPP